MNNHFTVEMEAAYRRHEVEREAMVKAKVAQARFARPGLRWWLPRLTLAGRYPSAGPQVTALPSVAARCRAVAC